MNSTSTFSMSSESQEENICLDILCHDYSLFRDQILTINMHVSTVSAKMFHALSF